MIRKIVIILAFTITGFITAYTQQLSVDELFKGKKEVVIRFNLDDPALIHRLTRIISIDHFDGREVMAYANRSEFEEFLKFDLDYEVLPPPASLYPEPTREYYEVRQMLDWDFYPSYTAYETMMYQFQADFGNLCEIINAGTLSSGRKILLARLSANIAIPAGKPQYLYVSSIHGDELTAYVLMLRFINYLLSNYGTDPRVTYMLDNVEIYINPLMNPDGTFAGGNSSVNGATRYNGSGIDLNRNFPDPDAGPHPDGNPWQQETLIMMQFAADHHFVMGGNFHGGAEVYNYPWDTWAALHPDDDWWQMVGREFADTVHAYCPTGYFNDQNNGITNGYAWYEVEGGRQDYMTYFHHGREATIEISNTKKPPAAQLPNFWNYLYRSLLLNIEQCTYSIHGIITDSVTGAPLRAMVHIAGHDADSSQVFSNMPFGDYHRLLYPGTWNLTYSKAGYHTKTVTGQVVTAYNTTITDVQLVPISSVIQEPPSAGGISASPNPGKGFFMIRGIKEGEPFYIRVTDPTGRIIMETENALTRGSTSYPLDLGNHGKGLYFLQIYGSSGIQVLKLFNQ